MLRPFARSAVVAAVVALALVPAVPASGQIVVGEGQTLSDVAAAHGVGVADLAAANGIADPNLVVAGTRLVLPARPYAVAAGDTLTSIAAAHGVTVGALVAANAIGNPNLVPIGTVLTIPAGAGGPSTGGSAPAAASTGSAGTASSGATTAYTVRPGDTLSGIAAAHGVSVSAVAAENGIADTGLVVAGRTLRIPPPPPNTVAATLAANPDRAALDPIFDRWAATYGVPADLAKAVTWLESGWQNDLRSSAGAVGIGQLLPVTVDFLEALIGEDLNQWNAEDNIRMSIRYLRWLLDQTGGDVAEALAGYYQGLASVRANGPFGETRSYVEIVLDLRGHF